MIHRLEFAACLLVWLVCSVLGLAQPPDAVPRPPTVAERIQRLRADRSPQPAIHLHAILVGDTMDAELKTGPSHDLARVRRLLEDSFTKHECTITELKDGEARAKKLFETIEGLKVTEGKDTVFIYISSHGQLDGKKRHILKLSDGRVNRGELVECIWRKKPQLGVLLTDACAVRADFVPRDLLTLDNWIEGKKLAARLKKGGPLPTNRQMVRRLLLEHQGMVDINSCQQGAEAASDPEQGGFFTIAFAMACCHDNGAMAPPPRRGRLPKKLEGKVEGKDFRIGLQKVDRDGNGFVDWNEFIAFLVDNYLAIYHSSTNQSAWIIRLNADDLREKQNFLPKGIRVMSGVAEGEVEGSGGRREKVGVGRTFLISDDEAIVRAYIQQIFPNRKDIAYAKDETVARTLLEQRFRETFGKKKVIEGTLKIRLTPRMR